MKRIWFIFSLLMGLLISGLTMNSSSVFAASDPSRDSYYLNDSANWTHYFYNFKCQIKLEILAAHQ